MPSLFPLLATRVLPYKVDKTIHDSLHVSFKFYTQRTMKEDDDDDDWWWYNLLLKEKEEVSNRQGRQGVHDHDDERRQTTGANR